METTMSQANQQQSQSSSSRSLRYPLSDQVRLREQRRRRQRARHSENSQLSKKGMKLENYRKLQKLKVASTNRTCSICMEDFQKDEVIIKLPCLHILHRSCCKNWVLHKATCPVCRDNLAAYFETDAESSLCNQSESFERIPRISHGQQRLGISYSDLEQTWRQNLDQSIIRQTLAQRTNHQKPKLRTIRDRARTQNSIAKQRIVQVPLQGALI